MCLNINLNKTCVIKFYPITHIYQHSYVWYCITTTSFDFKSNEMKNKSLQVVSSVVVLLAEEVTPDGQAAEEMILSPKT